MYPPHIILLDLASSNRMRLQTPEIAWHETLPIYSCDLQHSFPTVIHSDTDKANRAPLTDLLLSEEADELRLNLTEPIWTRLATAGGDNVVRLWRVALDWISAGPEPKTRRHLEDIYDVCWAPDSQALISGSVDHSLIVWQLDLPAAPKSTLPPTDEKSAKLTSSEDRPNGTVIAPPPTPSSGSGATKCLILRDHKHYVQGVTWDPLGFYVASLSSDRACRVYRAGTRTCLAHVAKAGKQRLFQDDSWKSFFRRLTFSPDGLLLACPSGNLEGAVFAGSVAAAASLATSGAVQPEPTNTLPLPVAAPQHAAHLFLRSNFTKPVVSLPTGPRPVVCVRFCPQPFQLRTTATLGSDCVEGTQHPNSLFDLPYRWLFCLVLEDGVLFYDTQQTSPFAQVSQFHYQALNDATWSADGHLVVVCSTDGYCSLIHFARGELGAAYRGPMGVKTDAMQPMGEPPSARMAESTDEVNTVPPTSVSHSTVSGELKNVEHSDVRPHTPEKPNDHSSIETSCAMDVSLHTSPSSPAKKRRIPLTTLSSDITPHALDLNNNSRSQTEHLSATTREQAVPPAEVKADIVMEHKMLTETSKSASYGQKRRVSFVTLDTVPTTLVTSSRNMDPPNSVQNDPTDTFTTPSLHPITNSPLVRPALRTSDSVRLASVLRATSARHMVPTSSGPRKVRTNRMATERLADPDVRRTYQNRLLESLPNAPPSDVNAYWAEFATFLHGAGHFACGTAPPGALKHWISDRTVALLKSRRSIPACSEHNLMRQIIRRQMKPLLRDEKSRLRSYINDRLNRTGEREKLKDLLRTRLNECGWREELKNHCREVIRNRGLENLTVDDLVTEITPVGRRMVPDAVKQELLDEIRTFLNKEADHL
ncbi:chromatin assembly factor 1 subunit B [Clonorchis sinensis]|uniref:Transcription and mRNA export factor ENY2 n=1 Tax=Clonorchis sinensis TaxID=79923 RepID=G7YJI0_CLOSI|nr:chromatin assembly factor 1 subunit B [Clonorchis sinensis]